MSFLEKVITLTQAQYDTLANDGTVGSQTGINDDYIYLTTDPTTFNDISGIVNPNQLPLMTGATSSSNGIAGIPTVPLQGEQNAFLRGDGTWGNYVPNSFTITLTASNWSNNSQTVTANGVTSDNTVIVGPVPDSLNAYLSSSIACTNQSANLLVFTAATTPATNIMVNVIIFDNSNNIVVTQNPTTGALSIS